MLRYLVNIGKLLTIKKYPPEITVHFEQLQKITRIGIPQMPEIKRMDLTLLPFTTAYPKTIWHWFTTYDEINYYVYAYFTDSRGKHYSLNSILPIMPMDSLITKVLIKGLTLIKAKRQLKECCSPPRIPA